MERARQHSALALLMIAASFLLVAPAQDAHAAFGFKTLAVTFTEEDGTPATQAGSHPFAWTTSLSLNTTGSGSEELPDGSLKDLRISLPPGLVGTPGLLPHCSHADFLAQTCPAASEVGGIGLSTSSAETEGLEFPLYNLSPLPGNAAELAFVASSVPVIVELQIAPEPPYNLIASITNASQAAAFFGSTLTIHGVPGEAPFLTLPRRCTPGTTIFEADPWQAPGAFVSAAAPEPLTPTGCGKLGFSPSLSAQPTTDSAGAPTGLNLSLDLPNEGLTSPTGTAAADLAAASLTLPSQMTINPALAAGLVACTPTELARERPDSAPGEGCPNASKIGTASLITPVLEKSVAGNLFVAEPDDPSTPTPGAENSLDTRFALYLVLRDAPRGVLIRVPIAIEPDPLSGRLTTRIEALPQLPFTHLDLRFNSGPRAPLITPPACGQEMIGYRLTPSSGAAPLLGQSSFASSSDCTAPSFKPAFSAGTTSNAAGRSAPFVFDLISAPGEPNPASLELSLPPGLSASFAAAATCPEPAIASADCPSASRLGYARLALGPGSEPLWIPELGHDPSVVFLAGPYRGAPYSLLIVVPAQAGPFDLGPVTLRAPIAVDPTTTQATVSIEGLPRILAGLPLPYRILRLVLDQPGFIRNPTSCEPTQIKATINSVDGATHTATERFQAADCAALRFRPSFSLRLLGGLGRNAHPALRAILRSDSGEAAIAAASFTLPPGELLDLHRVRALCARRLLPEDCPPDSRLGSVRLRSPLLDEPLAGPIYLREPRRRLPDLLADLRGSGMRVLLHGHTAAPGGRLRIRFPALPDLPLSEASFALPGGRRGIFVNSEALCARPRRAAASFSAHNGTQRRVRPQLRLLGRC